jgi:hypothetical protein
MYIGWTMSSAFNGEALKKECPYCSGGFPKVPKLTSTIMNTMKVMFDARTNPQSYYKEISVMNFMISLLRVINHQTTETRIDLPP